MSHQNFPHTLRRSLRPLRTLSISLVFALTAVVFAAPTQAAPAPEISVATDVDHLDILNAPCSGGKITVSLTNNGKKPIYADALLNAPDLDLTSRMISTYLPAGYTYTEQVQVRLQALSSTQRSRSPGWHSSTRQIASSVEKRMAFARPFFSTATFAALIPTASTNSPTDIFRLAS